MATTVQFRRANTANTSAITGAVGEITIDTDKDVVVVHDGSTAGGHALAKEASPTLTGNVTVGNSSVNVVANSTSIKISNSTVNTLFTLPTTTQYANNGFFLHANGTWTYIDVNGTPAGSNTQIQFNDSGEFGTNSLFTFDKATTKLSIGNSSVNATVNGSTITISSANVTSNTLTLGTFTDSANGYTYLPNGFKLNWGWVSANSSDGNATFVSAYSTNSYSVTATSNSAVATYQAAVIGSNSTVALIRTANATSTNVFFMVIGV